MRQRALWAAAAMVGLSSGGAAWGSTPRLRFVDDTAPPGGDGSSWASAYMDLQDALDAAHLIDGEIEIRIAAGVYRPDRGTGDRMMSFVVRGAWRWWGGSPMGAVRLSSATLRSTRRCWPGIWRGTTRGGVDPGRELGACRAGRESVPSPGRPAARSRRRAALPRGAGLRP